ncbi:MAG: serine/threonine protein kinase [Acidobacteria bacterium]|nr:MAG: serine/threonine protein kinase [Acidobacteriota bacterium]
MDPVKLVAYRNAFDHLSADEQHACLARLRRGQTYEQIALDLGEASAAQARGTVTRAMDRLLRDVFGGTAPRSERLADLLGEDAPPPGDLRAGRAPADMSPEEEALLRELLVLAKTEPPLDTWGKFTDLKEIGSGGFGTVYSAMDPVLQTRVALKLYHPHRSQRPTEELLGEARKLARVRHPNVVVVHGADEIDGRVGVWMELVEGDTLDEEVRIGPRLDAEAAAEVGIAICQALEAVHAAGVVHGDIKAQNVVRGTDGRIVLMDFGAARFRDPSAVDANETRTGTPTYMAPELFKLHGDRIVEPTVQSDVYAVGVLLFYLVTGKFPVQGRSAQEVRNAQDDGRMLLLRDARPDLRHQFVEVVETALARTPEQRQLSAVVLAEDLRRSRKTRAAGSTWGQLVTRVAGFATTVIFAVGALGLISSRAFEVFVGVDRDLGAGLMDYFRVGQDLILPLGVESAVGALLLGLLAGLRWATRRVTAWRAGPLVDGTGDSMARSPRWDPKSAAAMSLIIGAICMFGITLTYADIFSGLVDMQRLPDPSVDLSVLSPSNERHQVNHSTFSVVLAVGLGALLWRRFPDWEKLAKDVWPVRSMKWATVAIVVVTLAAAVVPHKVLWEPYEVVEYRGTEFYIVGSSDEELQLFSPRSPDRARWRVLQDDPDLVRTRQFRKMFEVRAVP